MTEKDDKFLAEVKEIRRQLRRSLSGCFTQFDTYDLGVFIPPAITVAVSAAEEFHRKMRDAEKDKVIGDPKSLTDLEMAKILYEKYDNWNLRHFISNIDPGSW